MTEPHPGTELDQPRRLGRCRRVRSDPKPLGRAPQQEHVTHRLGGRREQQPLRRIRKRPDAPQEALLDLARQRPRVGTSEPTGQLRRRQPPRQLQQGERITARFGDDPVLACARRGARASPTPAAHGHHRRADPGPRAPADPPTGRRSVTHREHHRDPLGQQTTRNESKRLRGDPIQPLGVIDHADQRLLLGDLGQQAEHRQPDQEPVRRVSGAQAERACQRITLRARKAIKVVQHRRAQQMKPGERQLHLGLDTPCPGNATS